MNIKNPIHYSRGQKRFGSPQKLARNLILILGIFYAGMMIISWEAHGHVTDAPVPIMKDLIPFSLNHYDYKYDYKTFRTPFEFKEEEEEDNLNFFPIMDDYTVDFNNKQNKCPITVVYIHPTFPNLEKGSPSLFALESIAALLPNACIVVQTSSCSFKNRIPNVELMHLSSIHMIYKQSFSSVEVVTQDMMENGRVRMSFLNHTKYNLPACDDFSHFSRALMNAEYWRDEFVDRDSDKVLMLQDGLSSSSSAKNDIQTRRPAAVFCHSFDLEKLKKFAFIATPLEQNGNIFRGVDHCKFLKDKWQESTATSSSSSWLANIQKSCLSGVAPMSFQSGFSYHSRNAMIRAIETCPHHQWSGMDQAKDKDRNCVWKEDDDGLYFSTVFAAMNGINLPTGVEASFFSVREMWPEDALTSYGGPFFTFNRQVLASESTCIFEGAAVSVKGSNVKHTVPISFDLQWTTGESAGDMQAALLSPDVLQQCPFVKYVL